MKHGGIYFVLAAVWIVHTSSVSSQETLSSLDPDANQQTVTEPVTRNNEHSAVPISEAERTSLEPGVITESEDMISNNSRSEPEPEVTARSKSAHNAIGSLPEVEPETNSTEKPLTAETVSWRYENDMKAKCDRQVTLRCNISNNERCYIDHGQPRCGCLSGYEKDKQERCIAVQYYKAELRTFQTYTTDLDNKQGTSYRDLISRVQAGLEAALQASRISSIYMSMKVTDLMRTKADDIVIIFEIVLPSSYAPKAYVILSDVKHGIEQVLTSGGVNNNHFLAKSGVQLLRGNLDDLYITAVDPCSSARYNYCDVKAQCQATHPMGFICSCPSGYKDTSPDLRSAPGELCKETCVCQNGGKCELSEFGNPICRCTSWYFGQTCSIDGKVLFIAVNAVIGGLILLALLVCCLCLKKMQQNENREKKMLDAAVSRDFPTVITYKMPSTWLERWSHLPEANFRLHGKHIPYDEPLGYHGLAAGRRRSDEFLSIPRPHLRTPESEHGADRSQNEQHYKDRWAWTMQ